MNRFISSHDSVTCRRSPEVSSTAFDTQPPDLPPVSLMDMGFAIMGPLARHHRPRIRFLFIGSRHCSTLLSGLASRPSRSLDRSGLWQFEASSYKAAPKDLPSSFVQHDDFSSS